MTAPVLVTGGTGTLGRLVAARLRDAGRDVRVLRPAGPVPDMAGPRAYRFADLIRGYLRTTHRHRAFMPLRVPGNAARAFRAGANLAPEHAVALAAGEDREAGIACMPAFAP